MNFDDMIGLLTPQTVEPKPTVMADTKPPQIIEEPIVEKRGKFGRKGIIKQNGQGFTVEIIDAFDNPIQWFSADTRKAANALLRKYL
jgi:hypothetical protein